MCMSDQTAPTREHESSLTETQRALLRRAVRAGYFKVPRESSLVDLAVKQGMSDREASEELRRGLDVVVRGSVLED